MKKSMQRLMAVVALTVAAGAAAQGGAFPSKPVTLVVPFSAGGPTDVVARTLGVAMGRFLGQSVVVENKVGAGGTVGAAHVAKAPADGHTVLIHHNGMATAPALYRKLSYSPLDDFEPIGQIIDVPMTLLGRKDLPAANLRELTAYLKANASTINFAHAGLGAVSHLCSLVFRQAVGLDLQTVPYPGTAPALTALLGGQVDLLCDQTTQTVQHIKADRVKLYGVTAADRIKALPEAPTLREQGLAGFQVVVWHGLYAPKGTPAAATEKLNAALRYALQDSVVQARMRELGAEIVPEAKQTPDGLRTWLASETARWGTVIRAAGVYAD